MDRYVLIDYTDYRPARSSKHKGLIDMKVGARLQTNGRCQFSLWAPFAEKVEVHIVAPNNELIALAKDSEGYWSVETDRCVHNCRYLFRINGDVERPDPASNYQQDGVHNASQIVDHSRFEWTDKSWSGIAQEEMIIYEIHVGTFTHEGTFAAAIDRLNDLKELGINAIEIMPVAQFPGNRNWGYDGVYPYAVQNSYGGPDGLKQLIDACHQKGISVVLDVVYNHLGPEGNYFSAFGPYFTGKYRTPWGSAINFDDAYCDGVRNYFIENALFWFREYHVDALRLDAVHAIYDNGAKHFLQELSERIEELSKDLGRDLYLIAESDADDIRTIRALERGGIGMDSQWSDDFHHCVHTLLTKETGGYYEDFGRIDQLAKALREGFVYSWQYSPHRKKYYGSSSADEDGKHFVIFLQNHDQVGNRMLGERLSSIVSFEQLKLAIGAMLCAPYIPLLFMGEEYGESAPFLYFVSHSDIDLINGVREGRKSEFRSFSWAGEPPDPQSEETFNRSKLNWEQRMEGNHRVLLNFYRTMISVRKSVPALSNTNKHNAQVTYLERESLILLKRRQGDSIVTCLFNFSDSETAIGKFAEDGNWKRLVDSSDSIWSGPGSTLPEVIDTRGRAELQMSAWSFAILQKENEI